MDNLLYLYYVKERDMIEYKVKVHTNYTVWFNLKDERHREDGPAIEWSDGTKEWYKNDVRHREDGPAVEQSYGNTVWYPDGNHHRDVDGAVGYGKGTRAWYINGKLHREDGPAIEYRNGVKEWYIHGVELSEFEFNKRMNPGNCKIVEIDGKRYKLIELC
jgi:hypothetical protein